MSVSIAQATSAELCPTPYGFTVFPGAYTPVTPLETTKAALFLNRSGNSG